METDTARLFGNHASLQFLFSIFSLRIFNLFNGYSNIPTAFLYEVCICRFIFQNVWCLSGFHWGLLLARNILKQEFQVVQLSCRYHDLVNRCGISVSQICFFKSIIILFDQWYKEDQTQVLPTYGIFSYICNHYYIILRMHKKSRKFQFYHKYSWNSKRVKRNEEKACVCVCLDAGWCLVSTLND